MSVDEKKGVSEEESKARWHERVKLLQEPPPHQGRWCGSDLLAPGVNAPRCDFLANCVYDELVALESVCIEIGVENGLFSNAILKIFEPKKLFLVDPWDFGEDKNSVGIDGTPEPRTVFSNCHDDLYTVVNRFSEEIQDDRVQPIQAYSYDAVSLFDDNFFDFIYIDATHSYGSVKADLQDWWPKLKPGGMMAGHDYGGSHAGVVAAVDEFLAQLSLQLIIRSGAQDWGVIKK